MSEDEIFKLIPVDVKVVVSFSLVTYGSFLTSYIYDIYYIYCKNTFLLTMTDAAVFINIYNFNMYNIFAKRIFVYLIYCIL